MRCCGLPSLGSTSSCSHLALQAHLLSACHKNGVRAVDRGAIAYAITYSAITSRKCFGALLFAVQCAERERTASHHAAGTAGQFSSRKPSGGQQLPHCSRWLISIAFRRCQRKRCGAPRTAPARDAWNRPNCGFVQMSTVEFWTLPGDGRGKFRGMHEQGLLLGRRRMVQNWALARDGRSDARSACCCILRDARPPGQRLLKCNAISD